MLRDDEGSEWALGDEVVSDGSGGERRRALRRKLPLGRGAVLVVGNRSHIVGLADVSATGAWLITRAPVAAGETHVLRILSVPTRAEVAVKVEIVRVSLADHESPDHPRGVAVRFVAPDESVRRFLNRLITRGPRLSEK
ncbi:MAG TPA: PilZ domain-containing protein [Vicinamibacteria bacterium]|nr:PilZ domain-containing protein [Vicinamibacteria bacterium]